ncbi:MAG: TonB-dependent receptor plug domain-containing protein [Pseudomonadota bacterium]
MFDYKRTRRAPSMRTLAILILSAVAGVAWSNADPPAAALPPVSVSAERVRAELDPDSATNPFRLAASSGGHSLTITRSEIEALRPRDVFDLLNLATGAISTQGSRKGFSGLLIRGDSNFRWIIDGAFLQPTMAARILRSLPVLAIEQIELVRGGSALTLGPMAGSASPGGAPVDGFVIVRTRKPLRDEVQLRAAAESFGTSLAGAWGGKRFDGVNDEGHAYVAGLVGREHVGSPSARLDNGAAYNSGRESTQVMGKAGIELGGWQIDLMAWRDDGSFDIPNANSHGPGQASWFMDPSRTDLYVMSGSKVWNANHTTLWSFSRGLSRQTFWTANTAAGPYASVYNENDLDHLNLRHHIDWSSTRVTLGLDRMHWDAPNGQQYYEGIRREELTRSAFAMLEQRLLQDRLGLDISVRRDRVKVLHGLDYYTGGAQPYGGVNSPLRTTGKFLPTARFLSVGASWLVAPEWTIMTRYGTAEQTSEGLSPAPGVALGPDRQRKWELGLKGTVSTAFRPSINVFRRKVENEKMLSGYSYTASNGSSQLCRTGVVPTSGGLAPASASNLVPCYSQSDTLRGGVELGASGRIGERGSYSAQLTRFSSLSDSAKLITPRSVFDVAFSQEWGAYTLTGALKRVSAYRGSAGDAQAWLGGYTRLDLGLGYDFRLSGTPIRATIYGRNLTNRKYETTNGIQDVGRVLGVELSARL